MGILKDKIIRVIDPDIDRPADAWDQGTDKKTGDRLVVFFGEETAIRRVAQSAVFTAPCLVMKKGPEAGP